MTTSESSSVTDLGSHSGSTNSAHGILPGNATRSKWAESTLPCQSEPNQDHHPSAGHHDGDPPQRASSCQTGSNQDVQSSSRRLDGNFQDQVASCQTRSNQDVHSSSRRLDGNLEDRVASCQTGSIQHLQPSSKQNDEDRGSSCQTGFIHLQPSSKQHDEDRVSSCQTGSIQHLQPSSKQHDEDRVSSCQTGSIQHLQPSSEWHDVDLEKSESSHQTRSRKYQHSSSGPNDVDLKQRESSRRTKSRKYQRSSKGPHDVDLKQRGFSRQIRSRKYQCSSAGRKDEETALCTDTLSNRDLNLGQGDVLLSGSDKYYPASSSSSECDMLQKETEYSSHTGSDVDYHPSSTPSSSEDEVLADEVEPPISTKKDHSCSSSSEHEILKSENQESKAKSTHVDEQLKGRQYKKRPQVTVKVSRKKDGGRAWDKAHYCLYCKKSNLKISRHLQRKHSDERDVAYAFSFPLGSKQRKSLLESLRNKGDWQHNLNVLEEGDGEIVTWKQPSQKTDVKDYLPCQHCYAMFKRTELWRHEKTCRDRKGEWETGKRRRIQKASSRLLPVKQSSEGIQKVIHNMLQDHVTCHIRTDEMICTFGEALFAKKGREQSQHRYIAQKMRELGRFVLAAKEIDKHVQGLKDICDPANFELSIKAARTVANYSTSTTEYGKPSTAVKIGFSLKGATEAWIGHCLMTSNTLSEKKAKRFKELLDNSWSMYVSANCHSTMEQRRWNKDDSVPLTEDVVTLQNYLRKIEDEATVELRERVTTTAYKKLSESLLAQIIVFNKKREGEASRLTLETYLKIDTGPVNKDIYETLSPVEKQLSHRLSRVVTRGKRGRKVPILLLERTKTSVDFMIEKRSEVGIRDDNPFLFARLGTTTNIRGCDCLRKYAHESKASNPELLRSTKLRKHVATLCQLLDLNNQELEQVARFMGHDIRVHCDYYRQTDKTFQVAKIGKLLFAMEHGAESLKGKSLMTLDSVVFGEEHKATSIKEPKTVKHRGTSDADRCLDASDDGEQPHLSSTSPPCERQKTATKRRHDGDDEDSDDDDGGDGEGQPSTATRPTVHKRKKTATKRHDGDDEESDDDGDGDEPEPTAKRPPVRGQKKTEPKRKSNDDAPKVKRPWTDKERAAVRRSMSKFIALRRVPTKMDCLQCIGKESPDLRTRTWKDVKYFVYNEILRIKRKLAF